MDTKAKQTYESINESLKNVYENIQYDDTDISILIKSDTIEFYNNMFEKLKKELPNSPDAFLVDELEKSLNIIFNNWT